MPTSQIAIARPGPAARPASKSVPSIVVLSDRALVRDLIVQFLRQHRFTNVHGRTTWASLNRRGAMKGVGLVLVDLGHRGDDPHDVIHRLSQRWPHAVVVALGSTVALAAQAAEANGWIDVTESASRLATVARTAQRPHGAQVELRDSPQIARRAREWAALTSRQRQVLALLGCGMDNHKLAAILGVSERAVKAHVTALLRAFHADSRTELAVIACLAGLRCPTCERPFA
jgi:DNA-binding NarL/FixJ family response regulator